MGTKRPFDGNLQEFVKYPKHVENGNTPVSFGEEKQSPEPPQNVMVENVFEISAPLPSVSGIADRDEASGPGLGPTFCPNLFSDFFEFNMPRRSLVHFDDTYVALLNCSPRKEVPIGPDHQAHVPEFDSDSARNYITEISTGVLVISDQEDETVTVQTDCQCMDNGSIRCVQQHVNEARLNLKESLGLEKFVNLGFNTMGEEVACNWTDEEQHFQDIIYSNPVSHGKKFWEVLSVEFPTRTKKDLVSYYFNVFIYRRRAIQNRSQLLAIDSDDDEWWGTKRGSTENGDFVDHGDHDHDSVSEDGDNVVSVKENQLVNEGPSRNTHDNKVTSQSEQEKEKPVVAHNVGLKSESYLHWDPPYSTMGSTKGVDLLPTCSMIEEIFGSSGKST
ncbi:putative SANT/Myb domain-containing protein [Helianthus debilis subsp. tardiflorus]